MHIIPLAVAPSSLGCVDGAQRVDGLDWQCRDRGHGHRGGAGLTAQLSVGCGHQLMVLYVVLVVFDQWLMVCGWGGAAWPRPRDVLRFGGASSNLRCQRRAPVVTPPPITLHLISVFRCYDGCGDLRIVWPPRSTLVSMRYRLTQISHPRIRYVLLTSVDENPN